MKKIDSSQILRVVRMTFVPSEVEDFMRYFSRIQSEILDMPGCRSVHLCVDKNASHVLTTFSIWDSELDLNNYRKSEWFGRIWPQTKAKFERPAEATSYFWDSALTFPT